MNSLYQFHREETVDGTVSPEAIFAFETDKLRGQAVGSQIRLKGRVLGIPLSVDTLAWKNPGHYLRKMVHKANDQ